MRFFVKAAAVLVLLSACAQENSVQTSATRNAEPPSRFQSIGSCEPTAWVGLDQDARSLPPADRQQVMRLLQEAQSYHAESNRGQCIITLQNAERIVRQGTGRS
ncbi:hypothetical protein JL101_023035 [Skermanella rosea]|uniref:hypothetical protein n=1 Tax=Skermanella rosea TaxID=1817965 RepID=UPI0019348B3E|nr:hypothetical protein [Skermanella rosea]UEM02819.1 hypothetical protein JL101_023035 [Skermanella rosea]